MRAGSAIAEAKTDGTDLPPIHSHDAALHLVKPIMPEQVFTSSILNEIFYLDFFRKYVSFMLKKCFKV
jgi:hypothetical protein